MKKKITLAVIVLFGLLAGLLQSDTPTESVVWLIAGAFGLLGALTLGTSYKELFKRDE
ncbi:hypothetical protein QRD89_06130 [Halobacillus sp. ACCC02827]|uniref:hypothetical protein n=1 Tax=Bacillaceae TaxID=186817 RepID=UPI00030F03C8|nr:MULTISPECIES: hypothetical protein [Bacillaceae]QHT46108.1 hypothetical protein M662_06255 [Bacillus sp. SB49]WJE16922.1 hypothetical protein QRD89_06130 [Halobacillus sp. ACCC02827]